MITPEALDEIQKANGYNVFAKGSEKCNAFIEGAISALTNPALLKAQNLFTLEEVEAARREEWEMGYAECVVDFVEKGKVTQKKYEDAELTFLDTLPPSQRASVGRRELKDITWDEIKELEGLPNIAELVERKDYGTYINFDYRWVNSNPKMNIEDGFSYSGIGITTEPAQLELSPIKLKFLLDKGFQLYLPQPPLTK